MDIAMELIQGNQMTAQLADDLINRDAQQAFENEKANFEKKKKYWNDILLLLRKHKMKKKKQLIT